MNMKVRKHFRTSSSTIDYIIADLTLNRIPNKPAYFRFCVNQRMIILSEQYNKKLDRILNFIILHCSYDNLPIVCLSRIVMSLSKVTTVLSKGFISIIER